jgi:hypothetical protein
LGSTQHTNFGLCVLAKLETAHASYCQLSRKRRTPMEKPKVKFIAWISDWFRARTLFRDYTINTNVSVGNKTGPLDISDNLNLNMIYSILNGHMTSMDNLIH